MAGTSPAMTAVRSCSASRKASGHPPHDGEAGEQADEAERDRADDVQRHEPELVALIEERGIERKGRERRVAAEHAGRQEQPPMLRRAALEGEPGGHQPHHERTGDVDKKRRVRKAATEQPGDAEIDAMPERRAQAAAEKYDEEGHVSSSAVAADGVLPR